MTAPFKLRSGNITPFKLMGSSPVKQRQFPSHDVRDETMHEGEWIPSREHPDFGFAWGSNVKGYRRKSRKKVKEFYKYTKPGSETSGIVKPSKEERHELIDYDPHWTEPLEHPGTTKIQEYRRQKKAWRQYRRRDLRARRKKAWQKTKKYAVRDVGRFFSDWGRQIMGKTDPPGWGEFPGSCKHGRCYNWFHRAGKTKPTIWRKLIPPNIKIRRSVVTR